jgi:hypothetical protein
MQLPAATRIFRRSQLHQGQADTVVSIHKVEQQHLMVAARASGPRCFESTTCQ